MSPSLIVDGAIIILLAITIIYAATLNAKLKKFRDIEGEFTKVIASFSESTAATEAMLSQVKSVANSGSGNVNRQQLNLQIQKAQELLDDLDFLVQRGEGVAEKLANSGSARQVYVPQTLTGAIDKSRQPARADAIYGDEPTGRSRAERELLVALKAAQ